MPFLPAGPRDLEAYRNPEAMAMVARDDVVALICNQRQRGRHSGIWTELPPYAQVFILRDGKLVRWRTFPDQESALKAAGLTACVGIGRTASACRW